MMTTFEETNNPPIISVLMAVHNTPATYLDLAIASLLGQTHRDFEFIIVDDGSNKATGDLLRGWAGRDCRICLHSLPVNVGLTKALNIGLRLVRGAYVARQDADDISGAQRLANQLEFLATHPETDAVCSDVALINADGNRIGVMEIDPGLKGLSRRNLLVHGAMMFRRRVFDTLGGYDERMRLSQDYELYLRMVRLHGMKIGILRGVHYFLRQHSASLSSQRMFRQLYHSVLAKNLTRGCGRGFLCGLVFYANLFADYVFTHRLFIGAIIRNFFRGRRH